MGVGKQSLSATNLAAYHHFNCDLYLYNTYHGTPKQNKSISPQVQVSELSKAQFQRGLDWESHLLRWLDERNLLLTIPSITLRGEDLVENILADERDQIFISGISIFPPQDKLNRLYSEAGEEAVNFGIAKPDLLEITRSGDEIVWKVIDAKASKSAKTSHHVQIYFYTLCLQHLLPQPLFRPANTASIWLPPANGFDSHSPSFDDLKTIDMSLLSFPVNDFLFHRLPKTLSLPRTRIPWHLNPMCRGCPFTSDCKEQSIKEGKLGSMSNISLGEAKVLKNLLEIWHETVPLKPSNKPAHALPDIEDLAAVFEKGENVQKLTSAYPITMRKAKRILALPARNRMRPTVSPVIEAARSQEIRTIQRRNYSCPREENIAIVISALQDPSSPSPDIVSFCISVFSSIPIPSVPEVLMGDSFELISSLAYIIETILNHQKTLPTLLSTQFYVWSSAEYSALQTHFINAALASSQTIRDIRLCIGALAQGASLLQTTFQPVLLSGVLLDFLSKGRRTKAELQSILDRMGLPTEGTVVQLKQRIQDELKKYQNDAGDQAEAEEQRRKEIGQVPRVVVLKREIERTLALPIAGFWDLPECASMLGILEECPSEENLFDAYVNRSTLEKLLEKRNKCIYEVLVAARRQISSIGSQLLVNVANPLSSSFMDVCHEEHLRKLFYMQQFEVLARLSELWKARIDGCPDAPVLEYHSTQRSQNAGMEHIFYLRSGSLDMSTSDKDRAMFLHILVEDEDCDDPESGNHLPVEALFDDLGVSGLVFPLNQYTRKKWEAQHPVVQKELLLADVKDITIDGSRTKVILQTWGSGSTGLCLKAGQHYRLSPRLVDFNINKVLSTLFELDLQAESRSNSTKEPAPVPFLQLMLDPKSFKHNSSEDDPNFEIIQEVFRQTGADMQKLFRELKGLDVDSASALVLKTSQNRAAQRILANRLTVIWGPPGTGKTHTIALSLLRLMHAQDKVSQKLKDSTRKIIFVTAMTHAAIQAVLKKLTYLVDCYRSIESLSTDWLEKVKIEHVTKGNDHPAPPRSRSAIHYLYAGTIYQLYNFSKKNSFSVDCVVIDEAGQLALSSAALVLRSLDPAGRIIIAGDSEQLSPILAAEYPKLQTGRHFGSILDCLMYFSKQTNNGSDGILRPPSPSRTESSDGDFSSSQSTVVQLTENFRLNPDLGEFVSTIYSRAFKPQKVQARQLASALGGVENDIGIDFAIQPRIMEGVQRFLLGLSKAMLRQPQNTLKPPPISGLSNYADSSATSTDIAPHPISLALLRLQTFSSRRSEGIGYEVHVRAEALVAAALITSIQRSAPSDDVFVATPHRVQRQAVRTALAMVNAYLPMVEAMERLGIQEKTQEQAKPRRKGTVTVDTVERLQGSEAAFVICLFSLPQSAPTDLKFLLERRRLNVAISRAKTLCILVSSSEVLRPPVSVFADDESAKGYAFLRAFEDRAWQGEMKVNVDLLD